jgi:hypothetical protein
MLALNESGFQRQGKKMLVPAGIINNNGFPAMDFNNGHKGLSIVCGGFRH